MRIILLHGRGQSPEVFKRLNASLVRKAKLPSQCPPGHYRLKSGGYGWYSGDRAQFETFKKTLGSSRDNILVGFSEGGRFAMEFTSRYPDAVALVVAMCFPWPRRLVGDLTVPAFVITSPSDAESNRRHLVHVDRLFASGHRPVTLVHDKGHRVYWGSYICDPVLRGIRSISS